MTRRTWSWGGLHLQACLSLGDSRLPLPSCTLIWLSPTSPHWLKSCHLMIINYYDAATASDAVSYILLPNYWSVTTLYTSYVLSPTLHDPMDCSPPGSSVHGISQARILEWVAISFSNNLYTHLIFTPTCEVGILIISILEKRLNNLL